MITKNILIEFANPKIRAEKRFIDIYEAAQNAQFNLFLRYKIRLETPYITDRGVVVKINIPEDLAENFNPGNHLRGMSRYLIKKNGDFYKNYRIGKRLLYYIEL